VSAVICAYTTDRAAQLAQAVDSLNAQRRRPDEIVVVIDHAPALRRWADRHLARPVGADRPSGDPPSGGPPSNGPPCGDPPNGDPGPAERGRVPIRVVDNEHRPGLAGARNQGIEETSGELVAFLDDDAVALPSWLETLLAHFDDPLVEAAGGAAVPDWTGGAPRWFPPEFLWVVGCSYRGLPTAPAPVRNLIGANMVFRRRVFTEAGLFAEHLGRVGTLPLGCEETELCIRIRRHLPGAEVRYDPSALVVHRVGPQRARWSYFWRRCRAEGLSKAAVAELAGADEALSAERRHVRRIATEGLRGAAASRHVVGTAPAAARLSSLVAGVALTGAGYLEGRLRQAGGRTESRLAAAPRPGPGLTAETRER
jgi:GT2 family glycosyltransferase